jgi:PAS domain S-box-containing protein
MKRILIVDDSKAPLAELEDALSSTGYEVVGRAASGREAVRQAELIKPDMVIMDIAVPAETGGLDAAGEIVERLDIPVVFLAGHKTGVGERRGDAGPSGYPPETPHEDRLRAAVETVLQKKEAEERLKTVCKDLIENTSDMIYVLDDRGNITFLNDTAAKVLGYSFEEIVGRNIRDFTTPQSYRFLKEKFKRQVTGADIHTFEIHLYDRNRKVRIFEVWERLRWEGDRIVELLGIARDVTERNRMEETLRQNEEKYRTIVEDRTELICRWLPTGVITFVNGSCCRFFGKTAEQLVGTSFFLLVPEGDRESPQKAVAEKIAGLRPENPSVTLEHPVTAANGDIRWQQWTDRAIFDRNGVLVEMQSVGRDITERKKAEQKLAESELRYRTILNTIEEGYYETDIRGNIIFVNDSLIRMLGYEKNERTGASYRNYMSEDNAREVLSLFNEVFRTGVPARASNWRLRKRNGSEMDIEASVSLKRNNTGVPVGFYGVIRDVTERKKALDALADSERRLQLAVDAAEIGTWDFDIPSGRVLRGGWWFKMLGYSADDVTATVDGWRALVHPDDLPDSDRAFQEHAAGKIPFYQTEYRMKTASGDYRWILDRGQIVTRDDENGPVRAMGTHLDITERKRAEQALRESEAKFRGVFETSRDFMYISSLAGKIIDYNLYGKEFFGYSEEEIENMTIIDLYHDPRERGHLIDRLMTEGFVENYEVKLRKRDGTLIDALATIVVRRNDKGDVIGFQGSVRDITQMRRLQQQLIQADKLSGLGTMISGVAHELNNPLTAIMGNAESLLMGKEISERQGRSLEVILRESERAAKIVSGMLTFAREHKQERGMIGINEVIMEAYRLREYNLKVSNIDVRLSLDDDLPPTYADPYQLQQVFTNIINNARDVLLDGGGGSLIIRSMRAGEELVVEFEDNGPGIKKENITKIFDPFFTTKEVGRGTGLGLSIAYGIVNDHGGRIDVHSEPGKGATFTVHIPVVSRPRGTGEAADEKKASRTGKKILVVDDEQSVRDLLADVLSQRGHVVKTSSSGGQALTLIGSEGFDAILLDIKMPGMDGRELYAHILSDYPEMVKRIIFITGDTQSEDTQEFLKVFDSSYVAKPFRIEALYATLNRVLER